MPGFELGSSLYRERLLCKPDDISTCYSTSQLNTGLVRYSDGYCTEQFDDRTHLNHLKTRLVQYLLPNLLAWVTVTLSKIRITWTKMATRSVWLKVRSFIFVAPKSWCVCRKCSNNAGPWSNWERNNFLMVSLGLALDRMSKNFSSVIGSDLAFLACFCFCYFCVLTRAFHACFWLLVSYMCHPLSISPIRIR